MFTALLGTLIDSVVKWGFSFFAGQMDKRNLVIQGQAQQAGADTAQSAKVDAAIAKAGANSPITNHDELDRLSAGGA